jgi:hypothetical protein
MTVLARKRARNQPFFPLSFIHFLYQHTQRANDTLEQGCMWRRMWKEWKKLECCIKSTIATYAIDWRVWYKWNSKAVREEWNWILNSQTSAHENEWDKWANGVYLFEMRWMVVKSEVRFAQKYRNIKFRIFFNFFAKLPSFSAHMHSIGIEFEVWNIAKYIIFGVRGVVDAVNAEGLK